MLRVGGAQPKGAHAILIENCIIERVNLAGIGVGFDPFWYASLSACPCNMCRLYVTASMPARHAACVPQLRSSSAVCVSSSLQSQEKCSTRRIGVAHCNAAFTWTPLHV